MSEISLFSARARDQSAGLGLAFLLRGTWRKTPPALAVSDAEVAAIEPHIRAAGVGALVFWRLKHSGFARMDSAVRWQFEFQENAARGLRLLYHLRRVVSALRTVGIEPMLFKGWAIARQYPDVALRPLGDIDLFVPAESERSARQVLDSLALQQIAVDLHARTADSEHATRVMERSLADLYEHSTVVMQDKIQIRILSQEDHLQLLCLHFMRHGGWRALWLCDIAVALETRGKDFDWNRCLGSGKAADAIACALGAAHQLLGAQIDDTPCAERARHLPGWFIPIILNEWSNPDITRHYPPEPIGTVWKQPSRLLRALRARWINPLEATMLLDGTLDEMPRALYQAGFLAGKSVGFLRRKIRRKAPAE